MKDIQLMQPAVLDFEKSQALYKERPRRYQARQCYTNIYRAITDHIDKMRSGEWKVAYGYYAKADFPQLLFRHCFILDSDGHVIDPTICTHPDPHIEHSYYVLFCFDSYSEYLRTIEEANYYPDLDKHFHALSQPAWNWARSNGYHLCG